MLKQAIAEAIACLFEQPFPDSDSCFSDGLSEFKTTASILESSRFESDRLLIPISIQTAPKIYSSGSSPSVSSRTPSVISILVPAAARILLSISFATSGFSFSQTRTLSLP